MQETKAFFELSAGGVPDEVSPVRPGDAAGPDLCGGPLIWSPKENKLTLIRGKDDVDLSRDGPPGAWICRECHRVVMMY